MSFVCKAQAEGLGVGREGGEFVNQEQAANLPIFAVVFKSIDTKGSGLYLYRRIERGFFSKQLLMQVKTMY